MPRKAFFLIAVFFILIYGKIQAYSDNDADSLNASRSKIQGYTAKGLRLISQADLADKIIAKKEGKLLFHLVDLRLELDYDKGHLPGAINIPLKKLPFLAEKKFSASESVVFYGYSRGDQAAVNAAIFLLNKGFNEVTMLEGGIAGWAGDRE